MAEKSRKYSRRGPVPRAVEEQRTHAVTVRFNAKERAELEQKCQAAGDMTHGKFLRLAALNCLPPPPIPAISCEAMVVLREIADELHAYSREEIAGKIPPKQIAALGALEDLLLAIRRQLIGLPQVEVPIES